MHSSPIISQTKKHYLKSLFIQCLLMLILSLITVFLEKPYIIEFSVGMLASLLPHSALIYWYFFRQSIKSPAKITALYQGEGIKWLMTILFIMISFNFIPHIKAIPFFIGYILMLILNNLVPFLLSLLK